MRNSLWMPFVICAALLFGFGAPAWAQQQPPAASAPLPPYGAPITFEQAKKIAAVAEAEIKKQPVPLAVAIVEPSGALVYYFRLDGTNYISLDIAIRKARSAAMYRQPTVNFFNAIASNNPAAATLPTLHPATVTSPGGLLIIKAARSSARSA